MRNAVFVTIVLALPCAAGAGDVGWHRSDNPDLAYARYRAKLDEPARNAELEAQRYFINDSFLRLYHNRRLASVPSRMIDPNLPVPRIR